VLPTKPNQLRRRVRWLLHIIEFCSPVQTQDALFFNNYVTINVHNTIACVLGVGGSRLFANTSYSM
jgi:hypothetical protein